MKSIMIVKSACIKLQTCEFTGDNIECLITFVIFWETNLVPQYMCTIWKKTLTTCMTLGETTFSVSFTHIGLTLMNFSYKCKLSCLLQWPFRLILPENKYL